MSISNAILIAPTKKQSDIRLVSGRFILIFQGVKPETSGPDLGK